MELVTSFISRSVFIFFPALRHVLAVVACPANLSVLVLWTEDFLPQPFHSSSLTSNNPIAWSQQTVINRKPIIQIAWTAPDFHLKGSPDEWVSVWYRKDDGSC